MSHKEECKKLWEDRFALLNSRKPTRLEKMSWRVGWNMASDLYEKLNAQKVKEKK